MMTIMKQGWSHVSVCVCAAAKTIHLVSSVFVFALLPTNLVTHTQSCISTVLRGVQLNHLRNFQLEHTPPVMDFPLWVSENSSVRRSENASTRIQTGSNFSYSLSRNTPLTLIDGSKDKKVINYQFYQFLRPLMFHL